MTANKQAVFVEPVQRQFADATRGIVADFCVCETRTARHHRWLHAMMIDAVVDATVMCVMRQ